MESLYELSARSAYPLGIFREKNGIISVSAVYKGFDNCGIFLFSYSGKSGSGSGTNLSDGKLIVFDEIFRRGNIYSALISDVPAGYNAYMLYEDGEFFLDPYVRRAVTFKSGASLSTPDLFQTGVKDIHVPQDGLSAAEPKSFMPKSGLPGVFGLISEGETAYFTAKKPQIPYKKSFIYCLNVRAFTKQDKSIKPVSKRGTLAALRDKIPYLKSLGVTAVELMPFYELYPERDEYVGYGENKEYNESRGHDENPKSGGNGESRKSRKSVTDHERTAEHKSATGSLNLPQTVNTRTKPRLISVDGILSENEEKKTQA